jgi:energy-coupling factor transporter ATP-binding protein EcfA2
MLIECKSLSFRYEGQPSLALKNVHARLEEGFAYHVSGANGSGKSTLLQLLGQFGLESISGHLQGELLCFIDPRQILYLQAKETADFVYDRVDQELYFGYRVAQYDHPYALAKVEEVLEAFQIQHWRHRTIDSLSKGQTQFFRLIMMLTTKHYGLLCMDEPFAHMDQAHQALIMVYLQEKMRTHGLTIVFADQKPDVWTQYMPVKTISLALQAGHRLPLWLDVLDAQTPPSMQDASIALKNVGFSYPKQSQLIEGLNTTIPASSVVEIIGPNGCGKSTLLSLIRGDLKPLTGQIRLNSTDRVCMATMIDDPLSQYIYPTMAEELKQLHLPQNQAMHAELQRSMVEHHTALQKTWMFQLVSQVRANVVLLDEPFAYLDPSRANQMAQRIRQLAQQGRTVLYTTLISREDLYDQQISLG